MQYILIFINLNQVKLDINITSFKIKNLEIKTIKKSLGLEQIFRFG